jgi:YidC/Oxa1 family membrane protein insertase
MDGKSILAVVLCVIVIFVGMFVQTTFFSTTTTTTDTTAQTQTTEETEEQTAKTVITALADNNSTDTFTYETDIFEITFDPVGASIKSLVMKDHANADGQHVDLVFKGESDHNAFLMYWGDDLTTPILDTYAYTVEGSKVVFTHDYKDEKGNVFTVKKTFEFKDSDYLFAVSVDIVGDSSFEGVSNGDYAYTIAYEPQVGPSFTQMKNNNYDYRRVYTNEYKDNGKTKKRTVSLSSGSYSTTSNLKWISLTSKYFTVIAAPESNVAYKYTAKQSTDGDIAQSNSIYLSRPSTDASSSDTVYFYCGPQLKKYLGSYYSGTDNEWGLKGLNLDDAMESGSWLGWLETILKWMLNILYKIIPNYGVGIILLTIILKLLLWPLSKKSTESTAKMSALNPQLEELRVKYKDNPQKLNQETADLYKQEGINPMGGCLPLLIQFPILIAFYGLLNKHFELRGAMFIPGWITDLSAPETIFTLGFNIPLLGSEIHLLPIIYTVSMILSMKMANGQSKNSAQGGGTMVFMTYGMPILFFFILYSAPSGLLLYWTVSNILSIGQQIYVNKVVKNRPPKEVKKEEKVPEAVRKYQEKLKKLEEEKAKAAKEASKNAKKNK